MFACEPEERPFPGRPPTTTWEEGGSDEHLFDAGPAGPPPIGTPGLCGNEIHEVATVRTNLYFVLDASGSMLASSKSGGTQYDVASASVVALVEELGPLVNVGATVFPDRAPGAGECAPGVEVFPVQPGDDAEEDLALAIGVEPDGETPTAATLAALVPRVAALEGPTVVVLVTDGAPTCNPEPCGVPGSCIGPTVEAIEAIVAWGAPVYVIGLPGSEKDAHLLDQMAIAGGAPNVGEHAYYAVGPVEDLHDVLAAIAAAAVPCRFALEQDMESPKNTNVYVDGAIVPYDPANGWFWDKPYSAVALAGEACALLRSGGAHEVQVVTGCPTSVR